MKKFLVALASLAVSIFTFGSVTAGAAAELRPYSAAAERGWTRPGSDSRPAAEAILNKTIKLNDGHTVRVDVCDDGIFRVRISPRKEFEESLMERYGCIKTDWAAVKTTESNKGNEWTVSTKDYSLTVNKKSGVISLNDAKGNSVVREIRLLDNDNKLCDNLRETINKKWESLNVVSNGGGIIGDDKEFAKMDKREIPGAMEICAISIKMEDGERFYGGGSTSRDHIQHRGELLRMWTTYQHTEIPMPFMMSSRGWGIYDNTTRKSFFEQMSKEQTLMKVNDPESLLILYLVFKCAIVVIGHWFEGFMNVARFLETFRY